MRVNFSLITDKISIIKMQVSFMYYHSFNRFGRYRPINYVYKPKRQLILVFVKKNNLRKKLHYIFSKLFLTGYSYIK